MTRGELAKYIDHTFLRIDRGVEEVKRVCLEAEKYKFASVAVYPVDIPLVRELLDGTGVKACVALGFPLGSCPPEMKRFETINAKDIGAQELDLVMNVGALKGGHLDVVRKELEIFVDTAGELVSKIILETCLLTDDEKRKACELAAEAGVSFVKTSTGFKSGGATVEDIKLMRDVVGNAVRIKASGGIRTTQKALDLIAAGADRLGCSASVALVKGLPA
jgi:deoxyribose-phosphate aldolase